MFSIEPQIKAGKYEEDLQQFHNDILKERHIPFINDFYSERKLNVKNIFEYCNLVDYKNYQLCVSSEKALQYIKLVDIIELPYDYEIEYPIYVDSHLKEYKKQIPGIWYYELIKIIERSVSKMTNYALKNNILEFAEDGIIQYLNVSREKAKEYIRKSTIEISINRAPDIVAHYSQEQLVSEILR